MVGADAAQMRQFLYSLIDWTDVQSVLDVGCGTGYDLFQIAQLTKPEARLIGIDSSESAIEQAKADKRVDERFIFANSNACDRLPFHNDQVDVVITNNLLECIPDKEAFLEEVHRILVPGGQFMCAHMDWDTQILNGTDKELVRKVVHTFADWKQPWMRDCDPWMGRRLWGTIASSNRFEGRMESYVLTNTIFQEPFYGWARVEDFGELVKHNILEESEYQRFIEDIKATDVSGNYFYSITMYAYIGMKAYNKPVKTYSQSTSFHVEAETSAHIPDSGAQQMPALAETVD